MADTFEEMERVGNIVDNALGMRMKSDIYCYHCNTWNSRNANHNCEGRKSELEDCKIFK